MTEIANNVNIIIVVLYLGVMLAFGWWGKTRTKTQSDYLVAGRRLGTFFYTGTMAAVVLGGASTVGGVGLGYAKGISGLWFVAAIGIGVIVLSVFFAGPIQRLKIYTVSQMLSLRYGIKATNVSAIVMLIYTLMLCATSTGAYATILTVLFGWDRWAAILIGATVVIVYSVTGGMWSITLADMVQFLIKTVGVFFLMLPILWANAGGIEGIRANIAENMQQEFFSLTGIGPATIIGYFVTYTLGNLVGQDIWQRVFTARTPQVARVGGTIAGVYCVLYGIAGALIGMAARATFDAVDNTDDVYASVAKDILPVGIGGIVLAAALAAMMSTASGGLIAAGTVASQDIVPLIRSYLKRRNLVRSEDGGGDADVKRDRWWILLLGLFTLTISLFVSDVVAALTVAYAVLVCGLLVPIIGGFAWKRGTGKGAVASMAAGTLTTLISMVVYGAIKNNIVTGIESIQAVYFGLIASVISYIIGSLLSRRTSPKIMDSWRARLRMRKSGRDFQSPAPGHGF